jgi:hypothetical protein
MLGGGKNMRGKTISKPAVKLIQANATTGAVDK